MQKIDERFVIEARLGRWRYGWVYAAEDTSASVGSPTRRVTLRLLPLELADNSAALELFARAFNRVRKFRHPNVPRLYELDHDVDTYFITGELLDGETLRNVLGHLRPERLDSSESDELITIIGDVLVKAHDHGIFHGHVSPENVLVTTDQEIKLLNLETSALLGGSPISSGAAEDMQGLAQLAYELYTGRELPDRFTNGLLRQVPRRRRRAMRDALVGRRRRETMSVRAFLSEAGLPVMEQDAYDSAPAHRPIARESHPHGRWGAAAVAATIVGAVSVFLVGGWPVWPVARDDNATSEAVLPQADARDETAPQPGAASGNRAAAASVGGGGLGASERQMAGELRGEVPASVPRLDDVNFSDPPGGSGAGQAPAEARDVPDSQRVDATAAIEENTDSEAGSSSATATTRIAARLSFSANTLIARENQTPFAVEVYRSGDVDEPLEFTWWTRDGSARDGDDYARFERRPETFAQGERTHTLYIPIAADNLPEDDEDFYVELESSPGNPAASSVETAVVVVIDDDR